MTPGQCQIPCSTQVLVEDAETAARAEIAAAGVTSFGTVLKPDSAVASSLISAFLRIGVVGQTNPHLSDPGTAAKSAGIGTFSDSPTVAPASKGLSLSRSR